MSESNQQLQIQLDLLKRMLEQGRISQEDYRAQLAELGVEPSATFAQQGQHVQQQINVAGDHVVQQLEPGAPPETLREAYLHRVLSTTSTLSLTGIDPKAASDAEARLELSAVYTALLTRTPESHAQMMRGEVPERQREARRLSALEQLNRHPRLVLLGDPGSGKSTFVNFVAMCMAGELLGREEANLALLTTPLPAEKGDEEEHPQPWDHGPLLPVRVILRDFAARGLPPANEAATAEHLWRFIQERLTSAALEGFAPHLAKTLLGQGGLILLDGLDEVPEADRRREQIRQVVEDVAATFPHCRILVTSRIYAYQKQGWRLPGFTETVLAPFSSGQIERFVDRWYDHIAVLRSMDREDAQGRAVLLKRAIAASDRLQGLAERPLLLTLMASLHAWRGGSLPERREELYADAVDLLLDWWESQRVVRDAAGNVEMMQPSLVEWLKVDREKVRALLDRLAYQAHAAQPELVGTADVAEGDLVAGLMQLSQNPDVNPAMLVEYLSRRAGLLLPRGVGVYTFPHRTFQEYLAACHLTDHDYPDAVAELAREDPNRWREVALLAGAKAARGTASAIWLLVEALCYQDLEEQPQCQADAWGGLLAGQALVESANLEQVSQRNQRKVDCVRSHLVQVVRDGRLPPVERAAAGDALAQVGDPRFREEAWFLPDEPLLGFVKIPAGPFLMGERDEQHEVTLPAYYIARYPVTVAQFQAFAESRHRPRDERSLRGTPNHPVVYVTWHDAMAYCDWLTYLLRGWKGTPEPLGTFLREEGWRVILPSEAEWEKAASWDEDLAVGAKQASPLKRIYPWGDEWDETLCNTSELGLGGPSTVGIFPQGESPYGCLDMAGNVFDWTRSLWGKGFMEPDFKYPYDPADGRENLEAGNSVRRVLRGGSWYYLRGDARCAYRDGVRPRLRFDSFGFRVVVSPASPASAL